MLLIDTLKVLHPSRTQPILSDINLEISSGEFVVLCGPNGCGKSTLLKAIQGHKNYEGSILVHHKKLSRNLVAASKLVRYLNQDINQTSFGSLTVLENLLLSHVDKKEASSFLKRYFDNPPPLDQQVQDLSGGQRQILALSMLLARPPQLVLLDEHTSALDPHHARDVMALTYKIIKDLKLTALMVTHSPDDALKYGDRILVMRGGRVVFDTKKDGKIKNKKELLSRYEA